MREKQMLKKLAVALGVTCAVAAAPLYAAPAFSLGGYTGPITIKLKDYENLTAGLTVGSENYGLVRITEITDPLGNDLWQQGGSNGFLSGVFNGIIINSVTPAGTTTTA